MFKFIDDFNYEVIVSFDLECSQLQFDHALIIVKKGDKLLLTKHKERGFEFVGGKRESNETIEEAAIRETFEETGVYIKNVKRFCYYTVYAEETFNKLVFIADFEKQGIQPQFEQKTKGSYFLTIEEIKALDQLSFHMKDEGMNYILERFSFFLHK
uniref:NUDIX domain-containing protein n=1 Tax=uncultured Allobacillus sp. TaxID=1638025 RepID=UPI002597BA5C|nr:NUDIX domain-containing protein [uncultured Allobacillus sp.]